MGLSRKGVSYIIHFFMQHSRHDIFFDAPSKYTKRNGLITLLYESHKFKNEIHHKVHWQLKCKTNLRTKKKRIRGISLSFKNDKRMRKYKWIAICIFVFLWFLCCCCPLYANTQNDLVFAFHVKSNKKARILNTFSGSETFSKCLTRKNYILSKILLLFHFTFCAKQINYSISCSSYNEFVQIR